MVKLTFFLAEFLHNLMPPQRKKEYVTYKKENLVNLVKICQILPFSYLLMFLSYLNETLLYQRHK